MIKVGGYILGEFGNLIAGDPRSSALIQFQLLHSKFPFCSLSTRSLLLSTYVKFINLYPEIKGHIQTIFEQDGQSRNSDLELQQRSIEYLKLSHKADPDVMVRERERVRVRVKLSFLSLSRPLYLRSCLSSQRKTLSFYPSSIRLHLGWLNCTSHPRLREGKRKRSRPRPNLPLSQQLGVIPRIPYMVIPYHVSFTLTLFFTPPAAQVNKPKPSQAPLISTAPSAVTTPPTTTPPVTTPPMNEFSLIDVTAPVAAAPVALKTEAPPALKTEAPPTLQPEAEESFKRWLL